MPQLSRDGDDLGANDELIAFKDEGEQEEKRNVSAERDLDDVKSSLVNESETNSSSDSEVSSAGSVHVGNGLCCWCWSLAVLKPLCVRLCAGRQTPEAPSRCGEQGQTEPAV